METSPEEQTYSTAIRVKSNVSSNAKKHPAQSTLALHAVMAVTQGDEEHPEPHSRVDQRARKRGEKR